MCSVLVVSPHLIIQIVLLRRDPGSAACSVTSARKGWLMHSRAEARSAGS